MDDGPDAPEDNILPMTPPMSTLLREDQRILDQHDQEVIERHFGAQRRYLPTLADLVDRLTIVQLKAVFLPEHRAEYLAERALIEHDIDLILQGLDKRVGAAEIHAIIVIMLANRFIWENEAKARAGGPEQDKLLKLTHSINGVRATAKNQLSTLVGGRKDYKIDCFASEFVEQFGNWNVFE